MNIPDEAYSWLPDQDQNKPSVQKSKEKGAIFKPGGGYVKAVEVKEGLRSGTLCLKEFSNVIRWQSWIEEQSGSLKAHNRELYDKFSSEELITSRINLKPNWFGPGTELEKLKAGYTEFQNPDLLDKIRDEVTEQLTLSFPQRSLPSKKRRPNSQGLGYFSFDLYARGLTPRLEFIDTLTGEIIPAYRAEKKGNNFFDFETGNPLEAKQEHFASGVPRYNTRQKKVYLHKRSDKFEKQTVEIIVAVSAPSSWTAEMFLYNGIGAVILSELLTKAGMKVSVSAAYAWKYKSKQYVTLVRTKDYATNLDANQIALCCSDPRIYRYNSFLTDVVIGDYFGIEVPASLGFAFNGAKELEQVFQVNQVIENRRKIKGAVKADLVLFMGGQFTLSRCLAEIRQNIQKVQETFNR